MCFEARGWTLALAGVGDDESALATAVERRRSPRYSIGGAATARLTTTEGGVRIAGVSLADSSACGLSVESMAPAEIGSVVSVFFGGPMPGRVGVVRRCEAIETERGVKFRIGIDCGVRVAA